MEGDNVLTKMYDLHHANPAQISYAWDINPTGINEPKTPSATLKINMSLVDISRRHGFTSRHVSSQLCYILSHKPNTNHYQAFSIDKEKADSTQIWLDE